MPSVPDARRASRPALGQAPSPVSRRSLPRGGAAGGGAAVLLAAGGTGPAKAAVAPAPAPRQVEDLFTLPDLDFNTLFAFGGTGYGSAEFGELVTAVNQINAAGAS